MTTTEDRSLKESRCHRRERLCDTAAVSAAPSRRIWR
ncbi:hypothetical protein R3I93_009656 [Phoxinus phoxinus]|uniref:Uncharacterized protein n=1 Tax=Phoxinus phoxinus TaxID=58324 RepID=A0AAN9D4D8_9TELE